MMPTFPRSPLSFRTASFPQYGCKADCPGGAFLGGRRLKPAPGIRHPPSSLHPPFVHFVVATVVRSESGLRTRSCTAMRWTTPPTPGALARVRVIVSRFRRMAAYTRCIAVRERLGDPRVVPSFHCTFLPGMPSSPTPGSPASICSRTSMPTWPSPFDHRLGTPDTPAIRSARASDFVASLVRFRYGLPGCSPPCTDQTGSPSLRGLLLPGFQRLGLPPRCWI